MLQIHNYARWNGAVIGQGGPTDDQFAALWSTLATQYASEPKVAFGVVNEPHDLPDLSKWVSTVQAVVTAIRKAGATTQIILLPGTGWTGAAASISTGSAAALNEITNPDGSTTNLIYEIHQYFDQDGSGTGAECVAGRTADFATLADYMRTNKRQVFVAETGGANSASCVKYVGEGLAYLK